MGWAEFKPHLRGSLEPSPNQQRTASCCPPEGSWGPVPNPAAACWPLCKVSGSVDTVPEPSGCTQPPSLSSCDRRQAALSAAGCECSLPDRRRKPAKNLVPQPTQPWHQATRKEAARNLQGRTWVSRAMQKQHSIVHPLRDLANCSKLRMANVGWAEFKPHLRGSLERGPNQQRMASCCPGPNS